MIALLRWLGAGQEKLYECRHCGTNVDPDAKRCPVCTHDGIAVYHFE